MTVSIRKVTDSLWKMTASMCDMLSIWEGDVNENNVKMTHTPCRMMVLNSNHEGSMDTARTVRSSDVDASLVPSGLHAHESTVSSCPVIGTDG